MKNLYRIHGDYASIVIMCKGHKYITKVSRQQLDKVLGFTNTWRGKQNSKTGAVYVVGSIESREVLLHRYLCDVTDLDIRVDHKNHDTLDNRVDNLIVTDAAGNNWNTSVRKSNITGVRGVTLLKTGKFLAQVKKDGVRVLRKQYGNLIEATMAVVACRNRIDNNPIRKPIAPTGHVRGHKK